MPAARKFQQAGHRQPKACGRAALAAGLFSVLQGCAALLPSSAEHLPIALPAEWSAAAPSASVVSTSLVQWWERFNDPLLTTLVTDALKSNTGVLSAQAALRQARALRDVSAAGLWPTLNASATAQRNQSGNNDASNSYRVGLDAGWEIDIFGGNRRALDVAEAGVRASAASLADVQVSIAAEVALGYIALRSGEATGDCRITSTASWNAAVDLMAAAGGWFPLTPNRHAAPPNRPVRVACLADRRRTGASRCRLDRRRRPSGGTLSTAAPVPQARHTGTDLRPKLCAAAPVRAAESGVRAGARAAKPRGCRRSG
jgi:hypothetical protein